MNADEHWRRVEDICQAALEVDDSGRSDFIARSCGGDELLEREVKSFLAHFPSMEAFLDVPAAELAAEALLLDDAVSWVGRDVNQYHIVEQLGAGGMGVVYRAEDRKLGRAAALKFLSPGLTRNEAANGLFVSEAQSASALDHPNICTIYEIGEAPDDQVFLAMAYYGRETLQTKIDRGSLPVGDVLHYGIQVAAGLAKSHGAGIIHRDIKPANIVITDAGVVKIVDFGIATLLGHRDTSLTLGTPGTLAYMSPEQRNGSAVDGRSDLWALGVVLYEMLLRESPFKAPPLSNTSLEASSVCEQLRPKRPDVPRALETIVRRALAQNPDDRFQTALDVQAALEAVQRGEQPTSAVRRSKGLSIAIVVVAFAAIGSLSYHAERDRWALQTAAPEAARLVDGGEFVKAAALIRDARAILPNDPTLEHLWVRATGTLPMVSEPSRADVWMRRTPMHSVAVLPLANLTGSGSQEYFVDGLTHQLTSELARIPSLDVISGTSASRYKHRTESAPEIARQLGQVDGLIEGSVTRSGETVRVKIDLIDARTDTQIWARTYEGQLGNILNLYSDISRSVAAEIKTSEGGDVAPSIGQRRTVQSEAYDKFLQARYFTRGWQAGGCLKGEPLLQQAVRLDSTFSEAYAELAYCNAFPDMLRKRASEVVPAAHEAVARALELDDSLGTAHSMLGLIKYHQDFDWVGAEREFKRGLELSPSDPYANFLYGELLYQSGQPERGIALLRQGLRLDPFSLDMKNAFGLALRRVGQPQGAIDEFKQVLSNDPNWMAARFFMSATYADMGLRDEAVAEYLAFLRKVLAPSRANALANSLGREYATRGWGSFLAREIEIANEGARHPGTLWPTPNDRFCSAYWMAWRYARLGNPDEAFKFLEVAYANREHHIVALDVEPAFRVLRSDLRFQDLRRRIGLPGS